MTQRLKGEGALLRNQHGDMKLQLDAARTDATNLAAKAAAMQEARPLCLVSVQRLPRLVVAELCSTAASALAHSSHLRRCHSCCYDRVAAAAGAEPAACKQGWKRLVHPSLTMMGGGGAQKMGLMERDARAMKKELRDGIDTIHDKDRRIAEGKNKIVELEKFKYVLQYKIGELQAQDQPRQERLAALQAQIKVRPFFAARLGCPRCLGSRLHHVCACRADEHSKCLPCNAGLCSHQPVGPPVDRC